MTDQAVLLLLRRRAQQAKLAAFSPHDLRRSFISDLLDAGADMVTVQKLAGHASVQTTAKYDRRGEETKRRAVQLLRVPFVAP
jgi:site-specific recombinase XerD